MIRQLLAKRRFMREHRWTHVRLSEYLDGDLDAEQRARVEEHVRWCPECRRLLESLRRTVAGLTRLRAGAPAGLAPVVIDRLRRES